MDTKHKSKNMKVVLSILLIFTFMFSIPFISSKTINNDFEKVPNKITINKKVLETGKTYIDNNNLIQKEKKNQYDASNVKITSSTSNTIDTESAIINYNYVSVNSYDKKSTEPYEITFNVGTHGQLYYVYKSQLTDISKNKVKETGDLYAKVYSDNGFVTVKTTGFSTLILTMPDLTIPFYNTARINLDMYFESCDSYDVTYYNPLTTSYEELTYGNEKIMNLNYNLRTYTDEFNYKILEIEQYEKICYLDNCTYLSNNNDLTIECINSGVPTSSDTIKFASLEDGLSWDFYVSYPQGMQNGLIDYFDFNVNENHPDQLEPFAYSRFDTSTIYSNTPSTWAGGYGIVGGAYDFDGTDDYIDTNFQQTLTDGSISLWFNADVVNYVLMNDRSSSSHWFQIATPTTGAINFFINDGSSNYGITSTSSLISDGTWYHVVATWGSNGMELFLNGNSVGTNAFTGSWTPNSNIELARMSANSEYFDGIIDEVGIWDYALNQQEINYLYNNGVGRHFYNLQNPASITDNFCFSDDADTDCIGKDYLGELPEGETYIYLDNLFNAQNYDSESTGFRFYTHNVSFYDYTLEQEQTISHGEAYLGSYFDLALNNNDKLTINYHTAPVTKDCFDLKTKAFSDLTQYSVTLVNKVCLSEFLSNPPNEIKPISIEWNTATGFNLSIENISLYLNSYYEYYTDVRVTYEDTSQLFNDSVIYNIALQADFEDTIQTNIGNLTVTLDPTQILNNIIIDIAPVNDSVTYSGTFGVNVSNALGSIYREFTIVYGDVIEPINLNKATIGNKSVVIGGDLILNLNDYFYNLSYSELNFSYNGTDYFINSTEPCDNVSCPTTIEGINQITLNDFIIGLDGEGQLLFASLQNEIELPLILTAYDNLSNTATQNFYIITTLSIPMSDTQSYLYNLGSFISGLFPSADGLTTIESLSIVIGVILIVSILLIAMLWNKLGKTSIYIALGVDILLFLMFAGLNYISTGFLILISLLLLGLSYLKIRG